MAEEGRKRKCATMQHHFALAATDTVYRQNRRQIEAAARLEHLSARTSVVRIPVVVHVIFHTAADNIGVDQINSQIAALNRDFRLQNSDRANIPAPFAPFAVDTLIEFALAVRDPFGNPTTGITRTQTSMSSFPYNPADPNATENLDSMIKFGEFGKAAWPRDSYINMWVCNISGGLLGYAQFPGGPAATDGVVINHTAFGSGGTAQPPYNMGRTAVHEIGHFFNLLHIWGDDGGGCTRSDNVDDTPNQSDSNGSELTIDSFPHISCNNGPHGDMFMNYMDYVDDDTMFMFTRGQLERINATLTGARAGLQVSQGLTPVVTERLVTSEALLEMSVIAPPSISDERGIKPEFVFDGVEWVPAL